MAGVLRIIMAAKEMNAMGTEEELSHWAVAAFAAAFPGEAFEGIEFDVVATADKRHGDYQCNAAMPLARALKKPPRDIAKQVIEGSAPPDAVSGIEIAGPGFINFTLGDAYLARRVAAMSADPDRLDVPTVGEGKTVIVDYSSPNVAKRMHIAHIRSTVIGNALDRIHRFLGYRVIADNHIGDWGTQFGLLIKGYRELLDPAALEDDPVAELERIYVASTARAKEDDDWQTAARQELVKLQQGDADNLAAWRQFLQMSMDEFEAIYERVGVSFDVVRGESYYNDRLAELTDRLASSGVAVESEGALVVMLEDEGLPPCIVRKSDGAANYATTDLATIESRVEEFDPDVILYLTDEAQQNHFRQVFAVARRLGVTVPLEHVWFGRMRMPEGPILTREGNTIKLHVLLDEAEERALTMVRESSPEMPEEQQREVARAIGLGALKYSDLSQNRQSGIVFTWEKAMALDGNSAPYLQYAHARIRSVLDKYTDRFPDGELEAHPIRVDEPLERDLAIQLLRFPTAVTRAAEQYKPNLLADYLFGLAQAYSSFYQNLPFLKAEEGLRESRVRLCAAVAAVLRKGLDLLGIETPERI